MMPDRPDILGAHLEGPFLAMPRKGAHHPNCLVDPTPDLVSRMLDAADGCLRQITIAPGTSAWNRRNPPFLPGRSGFGGRPLRCRLPDCQKRIRRRSRNHDPYVQCHERAAPPRPRPIPAAVEDPRVTIELINDGFHVQDPMVKLGSGLRPIESPSSPTPWPRPTVRTALPPRGSGCRCAGTVMPDSPPMEPSPVLHCYWKRPCLARCWSSASVRSTRWKRRR